MTRAAVLGCAVALALIGPSAPANAAAPITATFDPVHGALIVTGDNAANVITISRITNVRPGKITVNGGAVPITGGTPTIGNTLSILVNGLDGNDTLSIDGTVAGLPGATLFGGPGHDTLTGGQAADELDGDGGNDSLRGGKSNDVVTADDGDDTVVWTSGDGSDAVSGGIGTDRLETLGTSAVADSFELSRNGGQAFVRHLTGAATLAVSFLERVDVLPSGSGNQVTVLDLLGSGVVEVRVTSTGTADRVRVHGSSASDFIQNVGDANTPTSGNFVVFGASADVHLFGFVGTDTLEIRGEAGADTILGQGSFFEPVTVSANMILDGGSEGDHLEGSAGNDSLSGGAGNDFLNGGVSTSDNNQCDGGTGTDTAVGCNSLFNIP